MILERHYDDEALLAIMSCGKEAVARDAHLSGCVICMDNLESYQTMAEVLGEKSVWDFSDDFEEGTAKGAAAIRQFVEKMDSEDATAVALVDELLNSPRQWWMTTVEADERYHTNGVLRQLVKASETKIGTAPPEALDLAAAAIAVADITSGAETAQIRAAAYRQHAFALYYAGHFGRALASITAADALLAESPAPYDEARLDIVRSLVFGAQERQTEALAAAHRAAMTFRDFGDQQRLANALLAQASLLIFAHQYREALTMLEQMRAEMADKLGLYTRAVMFHDIGACQQNLEQTTAALDSYAVAAALYEENGTATEAIHIRNNIGIILASQGKRSQAKDMLRRAQTEFQRHGMIHAAVMTSLEIAEIALLESNFQEVEDLCHAAIRQFEAAGVAYSSEALTALTFLREAAEQRRATQETVWHVKTYVRRLPDEPALLFVPAPLPPA